MSPWHNANTALLLHSQSWMSILLACFGYLSYKSLYSIYTLRTQITSVTWVRANVRCLHTPLPCICDSYDRCARSSPCRDSMWGQFDNPCNNYYKYAKSIKLMWCSLIRKFNHPFGKRCKQDPHQTGSYICTVLVIYNEQNKYKLSYQKIIPNLATFIVKLTVIATIHTYLQK